MREEQKPCGCGHTKLSHKPRCTGKHTGSIPCGCSNYIRPRGYEVPTQVQGDAVPTMTKQLIR